MKINRDICICIDHFQCQKTAVEQLKERFEKMNLTYDAYRFVMMRVKLNHDCDMYLVRLNMLEFKHQVENKQILVASKQQSHQYLKIIIFVLHDVYQSFSKL